MDTVREKGHFREIQKIDCIPSCSLDVVFSFQTFAGDVPLLSRWMNIFAQADNIVGIYLVVS